MRSPRKRLFHANGIEGSNPSLSKKMSKSLGSLNMSRTTKFFVISFLFVIGNTHATIFDNRFIPFLQRPYIVVPGRSSHSSFDVFFATASKAFGKFDREIGIPELTGEYNQQSVARSFVALGCPNPLPSEFQRKKIIWNSEGKLEAQGFEFSLRKKLFKEYYLGFYGYFMRVDTTSEFFLNLNESDLSLSLPRGDRLLLDRVRRGMNVMASLRTGDHASQTGFGDLDVYFMWQRNWDYKLKFRSIWAQASVGALLPAGQSKQIDEPTSIPFGGDGFWGAYLEGQAEFELKEDWKAGAFMRISKRFSRTKLERVPLNCEPFQFSPFISEVDVNPGPTFVAMGWANFENIHKGLGMRVLLTIRRHWQDSWNLQCCPPMCDIDQCSIEEETSWGSDYITLNVFYDFGKTKVCRSFEPIVFFAWDVPSNLLETVRALKTNKIVLGVEFSF